MNKANQNASRHPAMPPLVITTPPLAAPPAAARDHQPPPQGCCTAEPCPYLHVNLPPAAPVCSRFLRGYCPAGPACPHKHYTLRRVRDEKRLEAAAGHPSGAGVAGRGGGRGGGKRKERPGGGRRYFDASPADSSAAGGGQQAGPDAGPEQPEPEPESEEGEEAEGQPGAKRRRQGGDGAAEAQRRASDALKPAFLLGDFVPL